MFDWEPLPTYLILVLTLLLIYIDKFEGIAAAWLMINFWYHFIYFSFTAFWRDFEAEITYNNTGKPVFATITAYFHQ